MRKTDRTINTHWKDGFQAMMSLPVNGRITSAVGLRHDPIDGLLRFHNGVDIAVPEGTPVRPIAPGAVYFSGINTSYGNMVIIKHDDGMITIYAHNSLNLIRAGERVGKGTTIALSGSTGRSTGPHLHFEAWKNGENLTEAFLSRLPSDGSGFAAARPRRDIIRTSLQADGSILFTNLP
jgi:murein DD-endopeptidase MepM/ murein hydrolase activator NlpD